MTHHKMSNKTINLINQTHLTLTKQNIVYPTQFILITISGGQDSLCLFFILLQLKKQWKWHFGLLYCNHFWQIDSFYINSLIFKLGFFFLIPAYLSLPSENIFSEQKSRTWRYRQFNRLSTFYKYDIIFTGHTSTDKIETVLLQLLRGTGTRGLSTLDWIRPISRYKSVASPLLLKILPKVSKVYAKPKPGFPSSGETSSLGVLTYYS
jgi:tRNA(Ile)-lysidine synthase